MSRAGALRILVCITWQLLCDGAVLRGTVPARLPADSRVTSLSTPSPILAEAYNASREDFVPPMVCLFDAACDNCYEPQETPYRCSTREFLRILILGVIPSVGVSTLFCVCYMTCLRCSMCVRAKQRQRARALRISSRHRTRTPRENNRHRTRTPRVNNKQRTQEKVALYLLRHSNAEAIENT